MIFKRVKINYLSIGKCVSGSPADVTAMDVFRVTQLKCRLWNTATFHCVSVSLSVYKIGIVAVETGKVSSSNGCQTNIPPPAAAQAHRHAPLTSEAVLWNRRREMSPVIGLWSMRWGNTDSPLPSVAAFPEDFQPHVSFCQMYVVWWGPSLHILLEEEDSHRCHISFKRILFLFFPQLAS